MKKHFKSCFFILKAFKDILQHIKFVNWWFRSFDVTNRLLNYKNYFPLQRVPKLQRSISSGSHRILGSARRSRMKSGRNRGLAGGQHPRQVKNPSNHQKFSNSSTSRGSSRRSSSTAGQSAAAGGSRKPKTSDAGADNSDNGDHSKNPRLLKFLSEVFVATSIYLSKKFPV